MLKCFILLIRKLICVTIIEFKSLLRCYLRIDVCCTYRLRIANVFQPFWPVTEKILILNKSHLWAGPPSTGEGRGISEGPCTTNGRTRVCSTRIRVTVLRCKKHDRSTLYSALGLWCEWNNFTFFDAVIAWFSRDGGSRPLNMWPLCPVETSRTN
jgi:hypothetical protein